MSINNKGSAKGAIGSVLGTVTAVSSAVTGLFETASDSVGMLSAYVGAASDKQRVSIDYDLATFEEKLLTDLATEEARNNREIKTFFAEAPENQAMWESAHERIRRAVESRRNPGQAATVTA